MSRTTEALRGLATTPAITLGESATPDIARNFAQSVAERLAYEARADREDAYTAQGRMDDLRRVIPDAVRMFRALKELGHSDPWLKNAINDLLDQVANIQGECRKDMDGLLCNFVPVDTSELERIK